VALSAATSAKTTFAAAAGQTYSFRLTVKDALGLQGIARVNVNTGNPAPPQIITFTANPATINAGQSSTLSWQVINADSVSITTLGTVALASSQGVTPPATTTYTLTATRGTQTATATATVTVGSTSGGLPRIVSFAANPATIDFGQNSTLQWVVENATSVNITTIGTVGLTGSHSVSPASTATYTITATNANGTVTANTVLTVITSVKILSFTATPPTVTSGAFAILVCQTAGASQVNVSGILFNTDTAVVQVRVIQTTTYTCTATAANGQTTSAQTTVTVTGPIDP
jgi:hypothetical protein